MMIRVPKMMQKYSDKIWTNKDQNSVVDGDKSFSSLIQLIVEESCCIIIAVYSMFSLLVIPLDMIFRITQYYLTGYIDAMTSLDGKSTSLVKLTLSTCILAVVCLISIVHVYLPIYNSLLSVIVNVRNILLVFTLGIFF